MLIDRLVFKRFHLSLSLVPSSNIHFQKGLFNNDVDFGDGIFLRPRDGIDFIWGPIAFNRFAFFLN